MVFVADAVPDELMRIVEFLNEQMNPAEVFAVEVKQFRAQGHGGTVIVPAVYGRTAAASTKSAGRKPIERASAVAAADPETREVERLLKEFADDLGLGVYDASSSTSVKASDGTSLASVYFGRWNQLEVQLVELRSHGWTDEADRIVEELRALTTKTLTTKRPLVPARDVVANWGRVRSVLSSMAELYARVDGGSTG